MALGRGRNIPQLIDNHALGYPVRQEFPLGFDDLISLKVFADGHILDLCSLHIPVLDNEISRLQQLIVYAVKRNQQLELPALPVFPGPDQRCDSLYQAKHHHFGVVNIHLHDYTPR